MNIFVGNLAFSETDESLESHFSAYGGVQSSRIVTDRDTRRSRGFGFVEMGDEDEAKAAIEALNGREVNGRALTVNESRPREDRGPRGGSGGGGGGGGGGNRW